MALAVCLAALLFGGDSAPKRPDAPRSLVLVVSPEWPDPVLDRLSAFARRRGARLTVVEEGQAVTAGSRVVRLALAPGSSDFRRRLRRFRITVDTRGFVFDGRRYRGAADAIGVVAPDADAEVLVLANSPEAARPLLRWAIGEDRPAGSFRAVSGELTSDGRFVRAAAGLEIDRGSRVDRIEERDRFFEALATERRGDVEWRFRESERPAFARWAAVARRHLAGTGPAGANRAAAAVVILFPDPATKALYTGSSRPADLAWEEGRPRVDVDASAPGEPDLVTPVLASASMAARRPGWRDRPLLLVAAGARAAGRWWGRDVATFAAFAERAGVHPEVSEVLAAPDRDDLSPVVAVGSVASWIDAGIASDGAPAVEEALAAAEPRLRASLERWRRLAVARPAPPAPRRRPMPGGFLRGVSYAMSNSIEGSYASPQSLESLRRLSRMSVDSISVMPFGFSRTERVPEIGFVHRSPRGETDEGTVRAVSDARAVGMTAMVKPQIWVGDGAFVGTIAMAGPEEWRRWFRAYRRFVVHHALVAEASGAALFCVGTELSGTEAQAEEWRRTIAAVRLATGARLLYATNWAAGAPNVRFWDALDAVGVDFYDPLSADPAASDTELVEGVRRVARPLARLAAAVGRPVVFAEAGYPPARGAWTAPHDESAARPYAPEDAARAVRAVFAGLSGESWWKGVYWWKAFSDGRDASPSDRGFNFLGRPAGSAIAAGFRRLSAEESR